MKKIILIISVFLVLAIPASAYPITDLKLDSSPDNIIAGDSYVIEYSFTNEHHTDIMLRLDFNISNVENYNEFTIDFYHDNNILTRTESSPGHYKINEFPVSPGANKIEVNLTPAINLESGDYTFNLTLYNEDVRIIKEHYIHGGGRIIVPTETATATPEITPTKEPIPTPTIQPTYATPQPTVTVTTSPIPSTPTPTPEKTLEQWIPGVPGFGAAATVIGLLAAVIYLTRRR